MEQEQILASIRDFITREIAPRSAQVDQEEKLTDDLWQRLGKQGLLGLIVPSRWNGVSASNSEFMAATEALGAACGSTAWAYLAHCSAEQALIATGTDAQKDRWLPALSEGRSIGAALVATETGGGSNLMAIQTLANRKDGSFVLNGRKHFITLAGVADLYVVVARLSDAPESGALSCFLVEKEDPGVSFGKREQTVGLRGVSIGEIIFEDCRLPLDRLLGNPGGAMMVLGAIGNIGLLGSASMALGMAEAALNAATTYVKERKVANQLLSSQPGVQAIVGDARFELSGARAWLAQAAAWYSNPSKGPPIPAWMAKIAVTEAALKVIERSMSLHGAVGYSRELSLERSFRDARALCIHWGNNDVLRDTLRKMSVLG